MGGLGGGIGIGKKEGVGKDGVEIGCPGDGEVLFSRLWGIRGGRAGGRRGQGKGWEGQERSTLEREVGRLAMSDVRVLLYLSSIF